MSYAHPTLCSIWLVTWPVLSLSNYALLQICEVVLRLSNNLNSQKHQIGAKLTQEGNREFRIDNVKRTLKDVKV